MSSSLDRSWDLEGNIQISTLHYLSKQRAEIITQVLMLVQEKGRDEAGARQGQVRREELKTERSFLRESPLLR